MTHWCGLEHNTFLGKVTALRILVGLARAVRRQIGNTVLGGCNRRPLEKITAFKVLSVWCSTKQGKLFLLKTGSTIVLRPTKSTRHIRFLIYTFILCQYIFLFLILNQPKLCLIG